MSELSRHVTPRGNVVVGGDILEVFAPTVWRAERLEFNPSFDLAQQTDTGTVRESKDYFVKSDITSQDVVDILELVIKHD